MTVRAALSPVAYATTFVHVAQRFSHRGGQLRDGFFDMLRSLFPLGAFDDGNSRFATALRAGGMW